MIWIWIGIVILAFVIEASTEQWIAVWFVPGAAVAALLSLFRVHVAVQCVTALCVAVIGILMARTVLSRFSPAMRRRGIAGAVGRRCVVTERIDTLAGCGEARVGDQIWSARGVGADDVFEPGESLYVVAIEGVRLICRRR